MTAELRDSEGMEINEKKVARIMRKFGIVGVHLRKEARTTEPSSRASVRNAHLRPTLRDRSHGRPGGWRISRSSIAAGGGREPGVCAWKPWKR
ncbi:transposase [Streptomyces sp. NPDC056663]|uniref:transposase n=1 Tax=Streptomyces sp. NPDC056663 TaxID=3345899 RepID=UPI003692754C